MCNEKIKVWYNPGKKFFELFYKGELLPCLGKIIIEDNFNTGGEISVTADFLQIEIIKEKP